MCPYHSLGWCVHKLKKSRIDSVDLFEPTLDLNYFIGAFGFFSIKTIVLEVATLIHTINSVKAIHDGGWVPAFAY